MLVTPVPVGTAARLEPRMKELPNKITIVSHPLFLTDGCAVEDFNWPDRIVVGTTPRRRCRRSSRSTVRWPCAGCPSS